MAGAPAAVAAGEAALIGTAETGALAGVEAEQSFSAAALAMATRAAQGIEQVGINLATAARVSFAATGALGLAPSIGLIQQTVASKDVSTLPPLRNLIDAGLARVVQFPTVLGDLKLDEARLNRLSDRHEVTFSGRVRPPAVAVRGSHEFYKEKYDGNFSRRDTMSTTPVDTYGWHTVSAVTYAEVNAAIAANPGSFPASFTYANGTVSATGSFGQWAVTTGGFLAH